MKTLAFSALIAASLLGAGEYKYEVTPVIGYTFPDYEQLLQEHTVTGVQMQFNDLYTALKPELMLIYSDTDRYDERVGDTDIFRLALNGVYEFQNYYNVTPFVKAGLGYETMSDHYYDNHNALFGDAAAGVKIGLTKRIGLKFEAMEMLKYNNPDWHNNLIYMGGVNFAFGETMAPKR